jgi:hypothetical protein
MHHVAEPFGSQHFDLIAPEIEGPAHFEMASRTSTSRSIPIIFSRVSLPCHILVSSSEFGNSRVRSIKLDPF